MFINCFFINKHKKERIESKKKNRMIKKPKFFKNWLGRINFSNLRTKIISFILPIVLTFSIASTAVASPRSTRVQYNSSSQTITKVVPLQSNEVFEMGKFEESKIEESELENSDTDLMEDIDLMEDTDLIDYIDLMNDIFNFEEVKTKTFPQLQLHNQNKPNEISVSKLATEFKKIDFLNLEDRLEMESYATTFFYVTFFLCVIENHIKKLVDIIEINKKLVDIIEINGGFTKDSNEKEKQQRTWEEFWKSWGEFLFAIFKSMYCHPQSIIFLSLVIYILMNPELFPYLPSVSQLIKHLVPLTPSPLVQVKPQVNVADTQVNVIDPGVIRPVPRSELQHLGKEVIYKGKEVIYKGKEVIYKGKEVVYKGKEVIVSLAKDLISKGKQLQIFRKANLNKDVVHVSKDMVHVSKDMVHVSKDIVIDINPGTTQHQNGNSNGN